MPKAATRTSTTAPVTTGAMHGETPIQRTVPAVGAPSVFRAANSVFDAGSPKPRGRGGRRTMLPDLDVAHLQVRTDVPVPSNARGAASRGKTRWDAVFDLLTHDGCSVQGIARQYKPALAKASVTYMRQRPQLAATSKLVVRVTDDDLCAVWRVAKAAR